MGGNPDVRVRQAIELVAFCLLYVAFVDVF